ncbi:hypothetical protein WN944_021738 [Citrus x changshan-huyou]|uniref:IQ domain-containing protein IQM1-like n=1 Tax=Citrus x changshan-huyou TaxID=2935761 RepID=A0AAP0MXB8_9ROSI
MITAKSPTFELKNDHQETKPMMGINKSFKKRGQLGNGIDGDHHESDNNCKKLREFGSDDELVDHHRAATKLQKFYKSYRTRRNLADCAVVVEELWWKELDRAALTRSSVSFFNSDKAESAVSRWERARIRAAKLGKGLCKDEKAQKLALRHWLEAIDPRHRYGHNLHLYYEVWFASESTQPFFYWLDIGDGKEVNVAKCPRNDLQHQCIKYLGPKERETYEVVIENGKLLYRQSRVCVSTVEGSKWIFVLSTSRKLYVGEKKKGLFQHSSFLAGGATIASGRLVVLDGILEAMWPFSGHYRPTEENFMEFCSFLEDHQVDLTNVKKHPIDDDIPPKASDSKELKLDSSAKVDVETKNVSTAAGALINEEEDPKLNYNSNNNDVEAEAEVFEIDDDQKPLSRKIWTTGAGPRISCVRDYPTQLQFHALEQVNLSPRPGPSSIASSSIMNAPVPSPRPSPKILLSPRLSCMGLSSPSPRSGQIPVRQ